MDQAHVRESGAPHARHRRKESAWTHDAVQGVVLRHGEDEREGAAPGHGRPRPGGGRLVRSLGEVVVGAGAWVIAA